MRRAVAILLLSALSIGPSVNAARDKPTAPTTPLELLVFEVEGCDFCDIFRRDVLPQYKVAPAAARAPIRFVDINRIDTDKLALRTAVTTVPTVVLMQDGREFDRITGYVGPSNFFRMISYMLDRIE